MQGIAVDLHRAHGRRNGPGRSVRPLCKAAAPSLLIGQVLLQVFQQGRPRIRVPGGVKGGVQPPAEEGPMAKRQPLVVRNPLRVRRVVLLAPASGLAEPEVLFQPGDHLLRPGNISVFLIVFQHPADQGLPHALPPPGGAGQKLLLQEPGHRQGPLQLLRLEKRLGLRRFCLRGHSDAFLVGIQVPVQLEEVHRNLSSDPQNQPFPEVPAAALGADVEDAVDVVCKGHHGGLFPRRSRGHLDLHLSQLQILRGEVALPLVDFKAQSCLVVVQRIEPLLVAGGKHTAPWNQHRHVRRLIVPAAVGGDPQGEGAHVRHHQVLQILRPLLDARAQANAQGHDFIRRRGHMGPPAEELFEKVPEHRQLGGAAHQNHVIEPAAPTAVLHGPGDDRPDLLEHRAAELAQEIVGQEKAVPCLPLLEGDGRRRGAGEGDLRCLRLPVEGGPEGRGQALLRQAVLLAEVGGNSPVDVVPAQAVVSCNGRDFDDVLEALHNAHIQRPAAEVHNHQLAVPGLGGIAVVQRGGGGLVDEPLHVQPRQLGRQLGGASLVVVEVGRDADDGLLHRLAQVTLCVLQELTENQGGKLLRLEPPARQGQGLLRAHPDFEGGGGGLRVGDQPLLGRRAHQDSAVLQNADGAAGLVFPQLVGDQLRPAVPVDAGQGVGGA